MIKILFYATSALSFVRVKNGINVEIVKVTGWGILLALDGPLGSSSPLDCGQAGWTPKYSPGERKISRLAHECERDPEYINNCDREFPGGRTAIK